MAYIHFDNYEIIKPLGQLGDEHYGRSKNVNLLAWNGGSRGVDIRCWGHHGEEIAPQKGIWLRLEEAEELRDILNSLFSDSTE